MSKLGWLLTLPVLGGPRLVRSLAGVVDDEVQRQLLDEDSLRGELLDLQERLDAGLIDEAEYELREARVLERLEAARALKAQ
ncbi:MAG: gas vesicle protein GvpG [Chloroflexota bacterium]